jgi:hypothetical protein
VVDWWTLSYVDITHVPQVVKGVLHALKPGGLFIVCLPVKLSRGNRGGPCDTGMTCEVKWDYDKIFKSAGFELHEYFPEALDYNPGTTEDGSVYSREAIWVLRKGS